MDDYGHLQSGNAMRQITAIVLGMALCVAGCSSHPLSQGSDFDLEEVSYDDIPGWENEDFTQSMPAMERACLRPTRWNAAFCKELDEYKEASSDEIKSYIESKLVPYRVEADGRTTGKITGYYESELTGTRTKERADQIPVYGLPDGFEKGEKYATREEIEEDGIDAPIIAWADDPVDLFLLHIQGSGRMSTPDGEIRLGYAGSNGRTFTGIGTILKEEDLLEETGHSMVQIREWLKAHPSKTADLLKQNERYIFFREMSGETPLGLAGVPLTPYHSIAVDTAYIPMQTIMWIDTVSPDKNPIRTIVVAQDTGAAIRGGIRADFFFGHGEDAFQLAGRMNTTGRYYLLLPK